jgi:hypothetical protein
MNRILKHSLLAVVIPAALILPASAATFTVYHPIWYNDTVDGSFAWAIKQSNDTPGLDVIDVKLSSGNTININFAGFDTEILATITDSVKIHGNNVTLVGTPSAVTVGGRILDKFNVQPLIESDIVLTRAHTFADVAPSISVEINDLNADGVDGFLKLGENSIATVVNSVIKNTIPYLSPGTLGRPAIEALPGSTLNLSNVLLDRINPLRTLVEGAEYAWIGAIAGKQSTLNMINSVIQGDSSSVGGVNWLEGSANIVSSIITAKAGGLSISGPGAVLNFVNSLFSASDGPSPLARIQAFGGGVANLIASTVQVNALGLTGLGSCPDADVYACNGSPLQAFAGGEINLFQSAVSTINSNAASIYKSYSDDFSPFGPGSLMADALSYVQPTPFADETNLRSLFNQPSLLTGSIPYELTPDGLFYADLPDGAALLPGSPLRSAIADADGANQLLSPIDGSVITTDVFGNPRTAFGTRDIGAVQSTQVPGPLPILGLAAAFRWSRRLRRAVRSARG